MRDAPRSSIGEPERLAAMPVVARAASSAIGIVNVNRVPRPGPPLSARMRPPCASTSPLQMARPRP